MHTKSLKICLTHFFAIISILSFQTENLIARNSIDLTQNFNLTAPQTSETQFYIMKSENSSYNLDGKKTGTHIYTLFIQWNTAEIKQENKEFTCHKFFFQKNKNERVTIPALENYRYSFTGGIDEQQQVFGIDHSKFENLKNSNGQPIPQDQSYHIYNCFIDFHAFCNVFAEPTEEGNGIQHLSEIGDKIIHEAAHSEAPTHLGKNIADGSFFKNGEITLRFTGVGLVNDLNCAIIGLNSGESSFKMIMDIAPEIRVITVGGSRYRGEIYKDLASHWVQKVSFNEVVISETTMPVPPNKINMVVQREIDISNVGQNEFFVF